MFCLTLGALRQERINSSSLESIALSLPNTGISLVIASALPKQKITYQRAALTIGYFAGAIYKTSLGSFGTNQLANEVFDLRLQGWSRQKHPNCPCTLKQLGRKTLVLGKHHHCSRQPEAAALPRSRACRADRQVAISH